MRGLLGCAKELTSPIGSSLDEVAFAYPSTPVVGGALFGRLFAAISRFRSSPPVSSHDLSLGEKLHTRVGMRLIGLTTCAEWQTVRESRRLPRFHAIILKRAFHDRDDQLSRIVPRSLCSA